MGLTQDKNFFIFQSEDKRGKWEFKIHRDLDQIQIVNSIPEDEDEDDGSVEYLDVDLSDLKGIRDLINQVLGE